MSTTPRSPLDAFVDDFSDDETDEDYQFCPLNLHNQVAVDWSMCDEAELFEDDL